MTPRRQQKFYTHIYANIHAYICLYIFTTVAVINSDNARTICFHKNSFVSTSFYCLWCHKQQLTINLSHKNIYIVYNYIYLHIIPLNILNSLITKKKSFNNASYSQYYSTLLHLFDCSGNYNAFRISYGFTISHPLTQPHISDPFVLFAFT